MSVPAYLLVPDGRGRRARPCWPSTATARASPRSCGLERHRDPQRRLRPPAGPARPRRARPRPALLRRARRLEPARPLRLRHQPGPRRDGRASTRWPRTCGTWPGASTCWRPTRWSTRHRIGVAGLSYGGTVTLFLAAAGRAGGRRGGERVLLVVGRVPQDAVEHVRLAGAARACSAGSSTSTSVRWWRPRPAARSSRARRRPLPRHGGRRRGRPAPRRLRRCGAERRARPRRLRRRPPVARHRGLPLPRAMDRTRRSRGRSVRVEPDPADCHPHDDPLLTDVAVGPTMAVAGCRSAVERQRRALDGVPAPRRPIP